MKLISILKKNFKLLIRSKTSAFILLIGPLLIILLVSVFFSGKSSYSIKIGYFSPEKNNMTKSFISALEKSDYLIKEFDNEKACIEKIQQSILHTCIIFPANFEIGNDQSNTVKFLVDPSRINLVYKVIGSVSDLLELESNELSYSLTSILLSRINSTIKDIDQDFIKINNLNTDVDKIITEIQLAKTNTQSMKLDAESVSTTSLLNKAGLMNETLLDIKEKTDELINFSSDLIVIIDDLDYNETKELEDNLDELKNETNELTNLSNERLEDIFRSISSLSHSLSKIESNIKENKELNEKTKAKLDSANSMLNSIKEELTNLKSSLATTKQSLEGIGIKSAETIVSPINTKIEPVISESSQSLFTFPFLLVLVIMYVALLISSTSILFEKNSKAFFRNAITPTRQGLLVISTFLTSFIVILSQTIIILILGNLFLKIPLLNNWLLTLIIVIISSSLFILFGMMIGYFSTTQESGVMISVVLGSVFMFLSNLVLPLESLAPSLAKIIEYNPYVVASELLRKSLLFNISFSEAIGKIVLLLIITIILLFLMIIIQILTNKKR